MYSSFSNFDNYAMISFVEENGVRTKVERGGRAFPLSDHASDITKALTNYLKKNSVKIRLDSEVAYIRRRPVKNVTISVGNISSNNSHLNAHTFENNISSNVKQNIDVTKQSNSHNAASKKTGAINSGFEVHLKNGEKVSADCVIIATGGLSYKTTGSTGDGYHFAKDFGLDIIPQYPSLVPLNVKEDYIFEMQGLSLKMFH